MRILLLADLHIGSRLLEWGEDSASRRAVPQRTWGDAVELALSPEAEVDAVLVAGDLFDRPVPEPELAAGVTDDVGRLVGAGKPVVILPGAYDGLSLPTCLYLAGALPDECRVITWAEPGRMDLAVGDESLHIYSFASIPGRTPDQPFAGLRRDGDEGIHLGLVHARLEGEPAAPEVLDWGRPLLSLEEAGATGLDLLVVGGGHEFRSEICGVVPTIQPGSPVRMRPGDDPDRMFTIAELGPDGVEIDRRPASSGLTEEALPAAEPMLNDHELLARIRKESSVRGLFARRLESLLDETDDPVESDILRRALALGLDEFDRLEAPHAH